MTSCVKGFGLGLIVLGLLIVWVCIALVLPSDTAQVQLPVPNGYDDFVKAGTLLVVDASNYKDASLPELQSMVASNSAALAAVRAGLQKESRVPLQFTLVDTTNWANDLPQLKALAMTLCAEARLKLMKGDPQGAADDFVETVQLGIDSTRGGVLIHRLVGVAIETIGFQTLDPVLEQLDAEDCKQVVNELDEVWTSREPLTDVARTEWSWSKSVSGVRDYLSAFAMVRSLHPFKALADPIVAKCEKHELAMDQLLLNMAARAYKLENGHPPESASELVPDYLKAIPIDPDTGKPLEIQ